MDALNRGLTDRNDDKGGFVGPNDGGARVVAAHQPGEASQEAALDLVREAGSESG